MPGTSITRAANLTLGTYAGVLGLASGSSPPWDRFALTMGSSSTGDVVKVLAPWVFSLASSSVGVREEGVSWKDKGRVGRIGLWGCMLVVTVGLSMARTAQAQKFGVVDLQAVLDQSVRGRGAKDRLRDLGDKLQQEIKTKLD